MQRNTGEDSPGPTTSPVVELERAVLRNARLVNAIHLAGNGSLRVLLVASAKGQPSSPLKLLARIEIMWRYYSSKIEVEEELWREHVRMKPRRYMLGLY